jgi:hypothetical protein
MTRYHILIEGEIKYEALTEEEFLDKLDELAHDFYETGSPTPDSIETQIINRS